MYTSKQGSTRYATQCQDNSPLLNIDITSEPSSPSVGYASPARSSHPLNKRIDASSMADLIKQLATDFQSLDSKSKH